MPPGNLAADNRPEFLMDTDLIAASLNAIAVAGLFLWFILWFPTEESERLGKPVWLTRDHSTLLLSRQT